MRLTVTLSEAEYAQLLELAEHERRPVPWQAAKLIVDALAHHTVRAADGHEWTDGWRKLNTVPVPRPFPWNEDEDVPAPAVRGGGRVLPGPDEVARMAHAAELDRIARETIEEMGTGTPPPRQNGLR